MLRLICVEIHPYHLKQYNNRWFLFGWEESKNYSGITNLALDRIINISETIEDIIPNEVNWADYFDEMIGVSRPINKDTVEVKLRFSVKRLPYVITKNRYMVRANAWIEMILKSELLF